MDFFFHGSDTYESIVVDNFTSHVCLLLIYWNSVSYLEFLEAALYIYIERERDRGLL